MAFSPDGVLLASGSTDKSVKLWDVRAGHEIGTLQGYLGGVDTVVFSPDGTLLASGSRDRSVRVWRIGDAEPVPTAVEAQGKADITWAGLKLAAITSDGAAFLPNFPNPFNPETWIPFRLRDDATVTISIYDTGGRVILRLDLGRQPAGSYRMRGRTAHWDGRSDQGELVSSGVYFAEMVAGSYRKTHRIVLSK